MTGLLLRLSSSPCLDGVLQMNHTFFIYLSLLAAFAALAEGKGGGKANSSSKEETKGRRPIFVKNGNRTECRDPYT